MQVYSVTPRIDKAPKICDEIRQTDNPILFISESKLIYCFNSLQLKELYNILKYLISKKTNLFY